ncbi:MAG: hypothetical protein F6K50_40695 [Moorea sp. SIO3I7]|nr:MULTISPECIES: hypothetical protein [unclassified Moorena]NEO01488.1 hypothetical protein [Moorena sp. SIO3I7]NEO10869.1 hypothetical protein [Moorena sp. SIO3E8]NEP97440.1 hypothetical protein [Moorena sp. SIO3F7]
MAVGHATRTHQDPNTIYRLSLLSDKFWFVRWVEHSETQHWQWFCSV